MHHVANWRGDKVTLRPWEVPKPKYLLDWKCQNIRPFSHYLFKIYIFCVLNENMDLRGGFRIIILKSEMVWKPIPDRYFAYTRLYVEKWSIQCAHTEKGLYSEVGDILYSTVKLKTICNNNIYYIILYFSIKTLNATSTVMCHCLSHSPLQNKDWDKCQVNARSSQRFGTNVTLCGP